MADIVHIPNTSDNEVATPFGGSPLLVGALTDSFSQSIYRKAREVSLIELTYFRFKLLQSLLVGYIIEIRQFDKLAT